MLRRAASFVAHALLLLVMISVGTVAQRQLPSTHPPLLHIHRDIAEIAGAGPTGALRWMSFYNFWDNPAYHWNLTEAAAWINLPTVDVVAVELQTWARLWAAGSHQDILWNVEGSGIFTCPCNVLDCGTKAMSGLKPDWAHTLGVAMDTIADLDHYSNQSKAVTKGFFLGDELLTSCGTPLANLTAVAQAIRDRFGPRVFIYTNEDSRAFEPPPVGSSGLCAASLRCAADGERRNCCLADGVPAVLDVISIDVYGGTLNQSGLPDTTCPDAAREADCVFDYLEKTVYPRLNPDQRVWIVPGLYGDVADDVTDELLVRKLELYWNRAIIDSRVVGIKPWHFNNDSPINGSSPSARWQNQFHLGAISYPKLMAQLARYGAMIKAAGGPQKTDDSQRGLDAARGRPAPWKSDDQGSASFCEGPGWSTVFKDDFNTLDDSSWTRMDATKTPEGACECNATYWQQPRSQWNLSKCIGAHNVSAFNYNSLWEARAEPSNVYVENGALVIKSDAQRISPAHNWTNITSGGVYSQHKKAWGQSDGTITRICVRSQLPGGANIGPAAPGSCKNSTGCVRPSATGMWATHWMMPEVNQAKHCWPCRGEIDVLEMINGDGFVQGTCHWCLNQTCPRNVWTNGNIGHSRQHGAHAVAPSDYGSTYHEYSIEFDGMSRVAFALDGKVYNNVSKTSAPEALFWPVPYFMILSTQIGGSWPPPVNQETAFPQYMKVDSMTVSHKSIKTDDDPGNQNTTELESDDKLIDTQEAFCGGSTPLYHLPAGPGVNDLNALFQYENHTHLMHQGGWEHWVSDDSGVHWRRLPPPLELAGGMDGSLSIVAGRPIILYDCTSVAQCKPANVSSGVDAGDLPIIGVARPSNITDDLLTNWTREESNPIVVRDVLGKPITTGFAGPSNLWPTATGDIEMTMITGQSTGLFRTHDSCLHNWTLANPQFYEAHGGGGGLFFPLPGGLIQNGSDVEPTHLLQVDQPGRPDGAATFALGRVVNDTFVGCGVNNKVKISQLDGPGFLFAQIGTIADADIDVRATTRASSRLMIAGWISIARAISVVRELSYDPVSQQLLSYPIAGLAALRSKSPLAAHTNLSLAPGATVELISSGASAADVEVELSGLLAQHNANVSLEFGVLGGSKRDHAGRTGLVFEVRLTSTGTTAERRVTVSGVCSKPAKGKTTPVHCVACPDTGFLLAPRQHTLSLRVLVDRTSVEFFVDEGKISCSGSVARVPEEANTGVSIVNTVNTGSSGAVVVVSNATVWGMGCAFQS